MTAANFIALAVVALLLAGLTVVEVYRRVYDR